MQRLYMSFNSLHKKLTYISILFIVTTNEVAWKIWSPASAKGADLYLVRVIKRLETSEADAQM